MVDNQGSIVIFMMDNEYGCVAAVLIPDDVLLRGGTVPLYKCEQGLMLFHDICIVQNFCTFNVYEELEKEKNLIEL